MKLESHWIWLGLFTVFVVAGGWWMRAGETKPATTADPGKTKVTHVDPAGAAKLIEERKVIVLDIRTPAEFSAGHIDGAINIDFNGKDFETRLQELDKSRAYLIHCASGRRSQLSLAQFKLFGFETVYHLDGGIKAWEKAGKPVK
jgi:rhodanese-related sulfurtransferase